MVYIDGNVFLLLAQEMSKTVLITGGAKGIGKAFSEKLASQGWNLVICGRDSSAMEAFAKEVKAKHSVDVRAVVVDLSKTGAARELFSQLKALPDALICNAADYGALGMFKDVDFAAWKKSFDLNFFSAAELTQIYLQRAAQEPSKSRRKVLLMSGGGLGGSKVIPAMSAYACSKAAIYRLVEILHEEALSLNIDINCLAPGAVKTGFTEQAHAFSQKMGAQAMGSLYEENLKVLQQGGESPELAANTAALLLSEKCDGISGRLISAKWDGGHLANSKRVIEDRDLLRLRRIDDDLFGKKSK